MQANSDKSSLSHDINSTLCALISALELVSEEWDKNPELVDKIIPLTTQKLDLLKEQLHAYHQFQSSSDH